MNFTVIKRSLALACSSTFAAAALTGAVTAQSTFVAQNNLLVIELESGTQPGAWAFSTATPGYAGEGYIRWNGPNLFNQPGAQGVFGFDFEVSNGGNYICSLRNRHENPDPTEENDVWIRMDNGPWIKLFSNMPGSVGAWTWESRFDLSHNNQPQANFTLSPGGHRVEFSGRSFGFKMDRLHLYLPGTPGATDVNQPESPRRVGSSYCTANANSSGSVSVITGTGSDVVADNDLTLRCTGLPSNVFGSFIVSNQQGFTPNVAGTAGNLCLGGGLGRYRDDILFTGAAGAVEFDVNLTLIPRPNAVASASPGETWRFQFWHRDGLDGNMSRGYQVTFN